MINELRTLQNVGSAVYQDLLTLDIKSIVELANSDLDKLHFRLQKITGKYQAP